MIRVGLLGWPVAHSRSPAMHRAAFAAAGLDGSYELVAAPPEALSDAFSRCRDAGWRGVNVTIPHKQAAMALCDTVDALARRAGAVNTVVFDGGRARGSNTDIAGFLGSVREDGAFDPAGRVALVLGAGGAARAVALALLDAGARVLVANRDAARASTLARDLGAEAVPLAALAGVEAALIVNATSAGLGGGPVTIFDSVRFERTEVAFDLVYSPPETPFLERAARAGCRAVGGLPMLARQGALAFEAWTGVASETVLPAMLAALI